jgi:hypothetical protein
VPACPSASIQCRQATIRNLPTMSDQVARSACSLPQHARSFGQSRTTPEANRRPSWPRRLSAQPHKERQSRDGGHALAHDHLGLVFAGWGCRSQPAMRCLAELASPKGDRRAHSAHFPAAAMLAERNSLLAARFAPSSIRFCSCRGLAMDDVVAHAHPFGANGMAVAADRIG